VNGRGFGSVLVAARRVRLLAVFAGLAWLLGAVPPAPVRVVLACVVGAALVLDALADTGMRPGPVRLTGWGRGGGER
jgi:hypothetical protein